MKIQKIWHLPLKGKKPIFFFQLFLENGFFCSSGGTRKLSMEELEDSLAQIKAMLKQRSDIIENLTPPIANNY